MGRRISRGFRRLTRQVGRIGKEFGKATLDISTGGLTNKDVRKAYKQAAPVVIGGVAGFAVGGPAGAIAGATGGLQYEQSQEAMKSAEKQQAKQEEAMAKAEELMYQREKLEKEVSEASQEEQAQIQADIQALATKQLDSDDDSDQFGIKKSNVLKKSSIAKILAKK